MAQHDVAGKLAKVPIFSGCSKRELQLIARAAKEVNHKQGTVIAREGERGIGLFLILEGECSVSIGGRTKAKLGPGDFFGEVALLDGGPRTATVTGDARQARRHHRVGLPRPPDGAPHDRAQDPRGRGGTSAGGLEGAGLTAR